MIQQLRHKGFRAGIQSVDKTPTPYTLLKSALYDGRVRIPEHERLYNELISLEWDENKRKVDHPPTKSKDLADCLAAVVYRHTIYRRTWLEHNIPVIEKIKFKKSAGVAPADHHQVVFPCFGA